MTSANESYDYIIVGAGSAGCLLVNRLYKNAANRVSLSEDQEWGAEEYHGIGGPLKVSDLRLRRTIADYFIQAATETGVPLNEDYNGASQEGEGYFQQTAHRFSAFTSSVCQLRPHSRGHMETKSSDPLEYPAIHPNYLSDERDHRLAVGGVKVARRIAEAPSLAPHIIDECVPGRQFQSDEELLHAARQYGQTIYHPTRTCKMGHDEAAEVDDRLRMHGIQNPRVVDASIMPEIVSGNTNAPTIMIAEKAADMISEDNLA